MKFRKRPVVVEAVQFFEDKRPWPSGVFAFPHFHIISRGGRREPLVDGDWIVTDRGMTVMHPDDFAATYEPVEEGG